MSFLLSLDIFHSGYKFNISLVITITTRDIFQYQIPAIIYLPIQWLISDFQLISNNSPWPICIKISQNSKLHFDFAKIPHSLHVLYLAKKSLSAIAKLELRKLIIEKTCEIRCWRTSWVEILFVCCVGTRLYHLIYFE